MQSTTDAFLPTAMAPIMECYAYSFRRVGAFAEPLPSVRTDAYVARCVEAPKSQLAAEPPKEQQITHHSHVHAGYKNTSSTCVSTSRSPEVQEAHLGMSHTLNGERESRGEENPSKDEHMGVAGSATAPTASTDTAYSTNLEQVSWRNSSATRNEHPRSLRSATSSGSRNGRSMLWQDLRDKHAEVLRDRISFRDLRVALDARRKAIDDEQAQFLQAMTTSLTDSKTPTMKVVLDSFHAFQTSRQALRPEIEALEEQEGKLIADEEVMVELVNTACAELLSPIDFPGGFLDFTQDSDPETASIGSTQTVAPPEKKEYDFCLKEVHVIREQLLDMRSENEQLLREQEKRRRLGRELDAFSLQALNEFEDRLGSLTLELDRAQAKFELAEVNWTSHRKRTEREEDDSRTAQPTPLEEPSRIPFEEVYDLQEAIHEDTNDCLESLEESDERASAIAEMLFQTENIFHPMYELPCEAANGEAINQARFINQWLLQRIQLSPIVTRHFAKYLANNFTSIDAQKLVELALEHWLNDSMEEDFLTKVKEGEKSRAQKPSGTSSSRSEWTGTNISWK